MKKFKLQASLIKVSSDKSGTTYVGFAKLSDLIQAQNQIGKDIFYSVNVRGNLFTGSKTDMRNPIYSGIKNTLLKISEGASPSIFLNNNQGCLLMCDSLNGDLTNYEVSITKEFHGIGNGQQTISIASFINNKYPINNDINILIKVMVGYSPDDCYSACESNNTSNKISQKDIISNDWLPLSTQLQKKGYILKYKKDKSFAKKNGILIDLFEENFYNFLNAYHLKTPWVSGDKIVERGFDVSLVSPSSIIDIFEVKTILDLWFNNNIENYDRSMFDVKRTGYIKSIIVTAYSEYYSANDMTIEEFIKLCFNDVIYPNILNQGSRVSSSFFTSKSNSLLILNLIEKHLELQKFKMAITL